ncbi:MAG: hypothetical protein N3D76_06165 [Geminocystis sp.]|nr:hypothetical protein [Geminocystis sp.]HIK38169.1 hypothetical protein [Geminocystis sp. M7585_C2015_104]
MAFYGNRLGNIHGYRATTKPTVPITTASAKGSNFWQPMFTIFLSLPFQSYSSIILPNSYNNYNQDPAENAIVSNGRDNIPP